MMRINELGTLTATVDGTEVKFVPSQMLLLAALLVDGAKPVPVEDLVKRTQCDDHVKWESFDWEPHREGLRQAVRRLNILLRPSRGTGCIEYKDDSYQFVLEDDDEIDVDVFRRFSSDATMALRGGQHERAAALAEAALRQWRGRPFGSLADHHFVERCASNLEQEQRLTRQVRIEALLAVGRYDQAVLDSQALVADRDDNERWCALLVHALYGAGRESEAHAVCDDYLGRHHGRRADGELVELRRRMLRQDPSLILATIDHDGPRSPMSFLTTALDAEDGLGGTSDDEVAAAYASEVDAAVRARRGAIFARYPKRYGAAFVDPTDAVLAASDIWRMMRSSLATKHAIRAAVVVHTGRAEMAGFGFAGAAVTHAGRLCDACPPGHVLVTSATWELVTDQLPLELSLRRALPWQPHPTEAPERVFHLTHQDDPPEDLPPLRTGEVALGRFPTYRTGFVGRSDERADISAKLRNGRLATITGPCGVGKTRLAVELAEQMRAEFRDGVLFCDVSLVDDGGRFVERLAETLGLPRDSIDRRLDVVHALLTTEVLLVLDGCELLRDDVAALVGEVLESDGRTRMLVTSQVHLGLRGEALVRLDPLAVPRDDDPSPEGNPSVELLRALASEPGGPLLPTDEHVVEVAQRTEGMPLAIELAATLLATTPPAEVAEQLARYMRADRRPAAGPQRHRSLQATFDYSFDLGSAAGQRLLAALSMLPGTWSLEQAEVVAPAVNVEPERVLALIAELRDLSLVRADVRRRYRMLDMIRHYAREHLQVLERVDAVAELHADYFLQRAETAMLHRRGPDEPAWASEMKAEFDDLRTVYRYFVGTGNHRAALRLVVALGDDLLMRERLEIAGWAVDLAAQPSLADDPRRVVALALAANGLMFGGRLSEADAHARSAIAAAASTAGATEPWMAHNVLAMVGAVWKSRGWRDHLDEMKRISDQDGDPFPRALAYWDEFFVGRILRDVEAASAAADALLALPAASDNPSMRSMGLTASGCVAVMRHDLDRARDLFHEALGFAERACNQLMLNRIRRELTFLDDPPAALQKLSRLARSFGSSGNHAEQVQTAVRIVDHLLGLGLTVPAARAIGHLKHSVLREEPDFEPFVADVLSRLEPEERRAVLHEGAAASLDETMTELLEFVDTLLAQHDPKDEP